MSRSVVRRVLTAGLLIVVVGAGTLAVIAGGKNASTVSPQQPTTAKAFTVTTADGRTITNASLRGRPRVIGFYLAGCAECVDGLNALGALETSRPASTLAVGFSSGARQLARFASAIGARPAGTYATDQNGTAATALGVTTVDTTVVLDARGRIVWRGVHASEQELRRQLNRARRA